MKNYTLDHVHLNSLTPFETAQWFADNFGAEVINPWTDDNGIAHVVVNLKGANIFVKGPTVNPPAESGGSSIYGIEHFSFHTDDIEGSVADLKSKGIKFDLDVSPTLLPNIRHAFLRGPDNILIELLERKNA